MRYILKLISIFLVVIILLTANLALSGCGLKGPLYYPQSNNSTSVTAQLFQFDKAA